MDMERKNIEAARLVLIGAICGDIIGSCYEWRPTKDSDFKLFSVYSRFTDDTVCSIAIADALMHGKPFAERLQYWCRKYPNAGYGGAYRKWIQSSNPLPYNSWGNGSAMRVRVPAPSPFDGITADKNADRTASCRFRMFS